ncbi:hypothetical protein ES707_19796 [subsurface metagenome]
MAEPLGKIEKPEAEQFKSKRKLCLVPLIFSGEEAPPEYKEKFNLYWEQAGNHIASLESKIGQVSHIYHESITLAGEEGLNLMEKLNPASFGISRAKCQGGAVFEATEDRELAGESMDWERFLLAGFVSQKVAKIASESYVEVMKKRYEYIARVIDDTLKDNEVGVLFIREGHAVQFPQAIEVFSVSPPALDEIHRWQRERLAAEDKKEKSSGDKESAD